MSDYLAAVLRSRIVLAQIVHMMTGNILPRLANADVANLMIPIPALEIQKVIATEVRYAATKNLAAFASETESRLAGRQAMVRGATLRLSLTMIFEFSYCLPPSIRYEHPARYL